VITCRLDDNSDHDSERGTPGPYLPESISGCLRAGVCEVYYFKRKSVMLELILSGEVSDISLNLFNIIFKNLLCMYHLRSKEMSTETNTVDGLHRH